jgi:hypothetical protein
MIDPQKRARDVFIAECFSPALIGQGVIIMVIMFIIGPAARMAPIEAALLGGILVAGYVGIKAYFQSIPKRWYHPRFRTLSENCADRFKRFEVALSQLHSSSKAEFSDLPETVKKVATNLQNSIKHADAVLNELGKNEADIRNQATTWQANTRDKDATQMYQAADQNIAQYRQLYDGIMAQVSRTEAQAAVFITTLDSLRIRMMSYQLASGPRGMATQEFMSLMRESQAQLETIDRTLEDIELSPLYHLKNSQPHDTVTGEVSQKHGAHEN